MPGGFNNRYGNEFLNRARRNDPSHAWLYNRAGGFNDLGFSQSLPDGAIAPAYQYASDAINAERNQKLAEEASNILYGGLEQLGRYRPGGLAQMSSGMYQNLANTQLAMRRDSPDLMYWARRDAARSARKRQRRSRLTTGLGMLGAAALSAIPGMQPFAIPLMMGVGAATNLLGGDGGSVASAGIAAANAQNAGKKQNTTQNQNQGGGYDAPIGPNPAPGFWEGQQQGNVGGPQVGPPAPGSAPQPGSGNAGTPGGGGAPQGGGGAAGGPGGALEGGAPSGAGGGAASAAAQAGGPAGFIPSTMDEMAAGNVAASSGGVHPYQVMAEALVADPTLDTSDFYDEIDFAVDSMVNELVMGV